MGRRAFLALLWASWPVWCQHYAFKYYGQAEGLRNLATHCLLQDRQGFIWVGTQNGLFRYDGQRFAAFRVKDGLPASRVEALHETASGTLWVATRSGLAYYRNGRFHAVEVAGAEILAQNGLASDSRGRIYAGTALGLATGERDASGQVRFRLLQSPAPQNQRIAGVHVDAAGRVWFGCGHALCRLEDGEVRQVRVPGLPDDRWDAITSDAQGRLWLRSLQRLLRIDEKAGRLTVRRFNLPATGNFGVIYRDTEGMMHVPTLSGLASYTGDRWRLVGKRQGLITDGVQCVIRDHEGAIWLGLDGAGLARWLGYPEWENWTDAEGLSTSVVWAITRDARGNLWAGTGGGINRYDAAARRWRPEPLLAGKSVRALASDPDHDALWAGARSGGIGKLDLRTGERQYYAGGERVNHITPDSGGRVWVASNGGLLRGECRKDQWQFRREPVEGGDANEMFFQCMRDSAGRIWAAGTRGLACLEGGRWRRFTTAHGLRTNYLAYIAEDQNGYFWAGYREAAGLSRLRPLGSGLEVRHFSTREGLRSDQAIFVGSDRRGWIWYGSDDGVDVFDGRDWRHYGTSDGLIWDDCDGNAFFADADGSVWIGTSRGLSHFRVPGSLARPAPVPATLVSVFLGDRRRPLSEFATADFGERDLRARFAALSFRNETAQRFRYRVAGLETRWHETDQGEARYPGLAPGRYTFEVIAGAARCWNNTPARFSFLIQPPWWLAEWFRLLACMAIAGVLWLLWQWRVRRMLRRQRMLEAAIEERTRSVVEQKHEIERLLVEARQATRLKSEFLANMSHEIRTPMNGIMGMTELALATPLTAEQEEYLRLVKVSSESLLTILNDILDFSKIEAGRLELESVAINVAQLIEESVKTVAAPAAAKGLKLYWSAGVPANLTGDPVRLRQVLLNLLSNAIKFTARGSVAVHAEVEAEEPSAVLLHFRVSDTGIGIPASRRTVIFEAFRQVDGSTTRRYGGTGLGLAICDQLTRLMDGRIWVESQPGQGSTFHFTARLALRDEAIDENLDGNAAAGTGRKWRILLAEDHAVNARLACCLLEKRGHIVHVAHTGREALEILARDTFDAVLMDVQMPEMDGLEATVELRRREAVAGGHTPVIAMTANAMKGDRELCIEAGMDGYTAKPVRPAGLFAAIEAAIAATAPRS